MLSELPLISKLGITLMMAIPLILIGWAMVNSLRQDK